MSKGRGTWQVGTNSFPWKVYEEWRRNKGWQKTARAQIDLCHFTRVLLIFGPWRWFWQSNVGPLDNETPFVDAVILSLLGFVAYAFFAWTSVMLEILAVAGGALGAVALITVVVWLGLHKKVWFQRALDKFVAVLDVVGDRAIVPFFERVVFPPFALIGRAGGWFGERIFVPAGTWFFQRPLFVATIGSELIGFPPAGVTAVGLVAGGLAVGFLLVPFWLGLGLGSLAALIAFGVAIFLYVPKISRRIGRWLDRRWPVKATSLEEKPKKEHPTRDVVWGFLVAKKHRICPIIQPTGGTE